MSQQQPIRVIVEKTGGCFSGCGTALAVLFLIAIAVKYWYVSVGLIVLAVAVGVIHNSQEKQKARRRPGPRDPWLNEVVVALADLGLNEVARNTGAHLGGVPLEGDVGLEADRFLVYVNLFADGERARQAELGIRATAKVRSAVSGGYTAVKTVGPVVCVANGKGRIVDEFRLEEVVQTVCAISPPPALTFAPGNPGRPEPASGTHSQAPVFDQACGGSSDTLEQLHKLGELRTARVLTDAEFEATKAELLRRI